MKPATSKTETQKEIAKFFEKSFSTEQLKKIRRLAMKYKIKLINYRKFYCSFCLSHLHGPISISRSKKGIYKTVICEVCKTKNKFKI